MVHLVPITSWPRTQMSLHYKLTWQGHSPIPSVLAPLKSTEMVEWICTSTARFISRFEFHQREKVEKGKRVQDG